MDVYGEPTECQYMLVMTLHEPLGVHAPSQKSKQFAQAGSGSNIARKGIVAGRYLVEALLGKQQSVHEFVDVTGGREKTVFEIVKK